MALGLIIFSAIAFVAIMVVLVAKVSSSVKPQAFCVAAKDQRTFAHIIQTFDSAGLKYSSRGGTMSQTSLNQLGVNRDRAFEVWVQLPDKQNVGEILRSKYEVEETKYAFVVAKLKN